MDKKTKTIVIVLVAVVALGGLYFGYNRWRQQTLANKILAGVYGVDTGLIGKITGGGITDGIARKIAEEAAKEEAEQELEEKKEAAKTPRDRYNETEEMPTYDTNSKAVVSKARDIVEEVFGDAKVTSVSTGLFGQDLGGSGTVEFIITRLATGEDLGKLNEVLAAKGLPIIQSGFEDKSAGVMAGSEAEYYTINFEVGTQTVGVLVMKSGN